MSGRKGGRHDKARETRSKRGGKLGYQLLFIAKFLANATALWQRLCAVL